MTGHFGRSCNEIMLLALFYVVNVILIEYSILYVDIIILETFHTKLNMFNLVHYPPNT